MSAKGGLFVAQWQHACGASRRLAQPAQAKQQQQRTDDQLDWAEREAAKRGPEHEHKHKQEAKRGGGARKRRTPASPRPDRKDDSEGLDKLDQRGGASSQEC